MAPSRRDLQLTPVTGGSSSQISDMEEVGLLDSYHNEANADDILTKIEEGRDVSGLRKIQVGVTGMTCAACSNSVEAALMNVNGVFKASVALLQNRADVVFDPNLVKEEDIKEAIEDAGFEAEILAEEQTQATLVGQFTIGGMTCAACVNSVEGILRDLPGVKRAVVALSTSLGEVEYDPNVINKDDIVNAIEDAGFEGSLVQSNQQDKLVLRVDGILNELDAQVLEGILTRLNGVRQFRLDRISGELEVVFDPEVVSSRSLVDGIEEDGFGKFKLRVMSPYERLSSKDTGEASNMFRRFISSLVLSIPLFFIQVICPHIALFDALLVWRCGPFMMGDWLKWALVSVIQFVIGKRFYVAAWRALRNGSTNMDVLVALGTSASYFYSVGALLYGAVTGFWSPTYFDASAMLITFVLLGKYLESLAKGKTSDAMKKLVQLTPATAILLTEGKGGKLVGEREIDALLIQPGDTLKVHPGAKIPADGVVVWGSSYVNESMVTGESVPVSKEVDSPVIGGTINMHGALHMKATKVGSDAVLSQIISLVETAQMSKAPIQKFADYVASIFVPVVITLALFTLVGWSIGGAVGAYPDEWLPENGTHFVFSLMFSISVVVIACPCALGLATPTAVMVATGVGATNGVLIKGGDALEKAHKVKYVIFDKTGTLTQGKATVTTTKVFSEMDRGEFLTLVASAEASSEHPLAKAIVAYARHFHFFDESTEDGETNNKDLQNSGQESKIMKLAVVSVVVILGVLVAWPVSAGRKDLPGAGGYGGDDDDDTKSLFPLDNLLSLNYYDRICPDFEKIVVTKVREWTKSDSSLGPALLRLIFHDCGVTGCDASVLLDYEGTERRSPASKTLRGFELIDDIKSEMEKSCPGKVSCADILTSASRAATVQLGGPYWPNVYGRRDSKHSYARDVEKVPSGRRDVTALLETFQSYGLNVLDLVVLSGAHTIGKASCGTIQSRLYNYNATSGSDPSIDAKYADYLQRRCRWASETVDLDPVTPAVFDNQYYINLQKHMGVLSTDQELVKDPRTAPLVKTFAEQSPQIFRQQFAVSMAKLVNVGVLTGEDRVGEIRKVCSKSNSRAY